MTGWESCSADLLQPWSTAEKFNHLLCSTRTFWLVRARNLWRVSAFPGEEKSQLSLVSHTQWTLFSCLLWKLLLETLADCLEKQYDLSSAEILLALFWVRVCPLWPFSWQYLENFLGGTLRGQKWTARCKVAEMRPAKHLLKCPSQLLWLLSPLLSFSAFPDRERKCNAAKEVSALGLSWLLPLLPLLFGFHSPWFLPCPV